MSLFIYKQENELEGEQTFYLTTFKGNTTQVAELAILYDFEPPIRINIIRSNYATYRFRSFQGNTINCDLW